MNFMLESYRPENREKLPTKRLETYLVFVRHGKSEVLEGADTDEKIDAKRRHTPEGEKQVYEAGVRFAENLICNQTMSFSSVQATANVRSKPWKRLFGVLRTPSA